MIKESLTQAEHDALEAFIDRYSLAIVLEAIADVCQDKAEYLRTNWQDEPMSRDWDIAARKVQMTAIAPVVKQVSR